MKNLYLSILSSFTIESKDINPIWILESEGSAIQSGFSCPDKTRRDKTGLDRIRQDIYNFYKPSQL